MDKSNACHHVPSGRVDASERGNKACPLMATSPKLVISEQKPKIELRSTAAENLLVIPKDGEQSRTYHCRDGGDRTLEESSLLQLPDHVKDNDIQDM